MKNKDEFYLICLTQDGEELNPPQLIGMHPRPKSSKAADIARMERGFFGGKYIYASRVGPTTFECMDTKREYEIPSRGGYTEKAWNEFLNQWNGE